MELNIQLFGGRGAVSSNTQKINFNEIQTGDTFQYKTKDNTIYNFEVTRKNQNDYTVQAMEQVRDGKVTKLFGPSNITTLYNNSSKKKSGIKLSQTKKWKRK